MKSGYHVMTSNSLHWVVPTGLTLYRTIDYMAQSPQLDQRMIRRAQQGDADAVTTLYQTYVDSYSSVCSNPHE